MPKFEEQHYDAEAFWTILLSVKGTILPYIWKRVAFTAVVGLFAVYQERHWPRQWLISENSDLHQYLTIIIGLFLVFRTNTSYERWMSATKTFSSMSTTARVLMSQINAHVGGEDENAVMVRAEARRLVSVLVVSIKMFLRGEHDYGDLREARMLSEREIALLEDCQRPPALVAQWLRKFISYSASQGMVDRFMVPVLDGQVTTFLEQFQAASYFLETQLPKVYAHMSKFALVTFAWVSPFVFADMLGWATPVAAAWLGTLLFALDEIAVQLEMPYGDDDVDIDLELHLDRLLDDIATLAADRSGADKVRHFRVSQRTDSALQHHRVVRFTHAPSAAGDDDASLAQPLLEQPFWR